MLSDKEKHAIENIKKEFEKNHILPDIANEDLGILLNLIEKQKEIIDSIKRILEDEELDYCDTLDEIYHFYEEVVKNDR